MDKCEKWRSRRNNQQASEYLGDVYDGEIWRKFNSADREFKNFLSTPHSYLLSMNVDWFRPFVRGTAYSTGAIYLTIQNLPRHERYRKENLILVGLIPGPSEPKSMNAYLTPLVEELCELWQLGVIIHVKLNALQLAVRVKAALSCCACDVLASRKICGFLNHNATFGCNKCFKKFSHYPSGNGGQLTDYSGFDRENWLLRTNAHHRSEAADLLKERTPASLQRAESNAGLRHSILLSLPYFDPVRFTVIDPMHNLYLGSGKHALEVWVEKDLITKKDFPKLEEQIRSFTTPYNAGRLPTTIGSGYGGFTANQWSNWITIFSPILLKDILPAEDLRCWLLFVRACSLLKPQFIRRCDAESADLFLLQYCKKFQELYGPKSITPNMHLHVHLKQCILDYGPLHSFWCYPFERYNGILGNLHTNRKSIESQLMKKFCTSQAYVSSGTISPTVAQYLQDILDTTQRSTDSDILIFLHIQGSQLRHISSYALPPNNTLAKPLQPHTSKVLTAESLRKLKSIYEQLYPTKRVAHLPHFFRQYGRVSLSGDIIGCAMQGRNNCHSSSVIAAYWPGSGSSLLSIDYSRKRIGVVQYFIQHSAEFYKDQGSSSETEIATPVLLCTLEKGTPQG